MASAATPTHTDRTATDTLRLGLIQHACPLDTLATPSRNVDTAIKHIRTAAKRGADIVVTQEMFNTPYFPQVEDSDRFRLAEPVPGPTTERLAALASELNITIVAALFEARARGVYHNTAIALGPDGEMLSRYRKMHIPEDPCFFEKFYFTPGDASPDTPGWCVVETPKAKLGILICWDQWFPEAARLTAMHGADILLYPTAIGYLDGEPAEEQADQHDAWLTMHRSHAIASGVFVAAVNRVGREDKLDFWGTSHVVAPSGRVIGKASTDQPEVLIVDCDLAHVDAARQTWPFMRDRRVDAYGGLTERWLDD